jgi:peptide/nickel transport system substrate-binding protein
VNKKIPVVLLASATVFALAACSAPAEENGGSRDVSVQLYNPPSTFSPLIAQVGGNELIQSLHWDSLIGVDDTGSLQGRLAESWEVSDDGLVWTFDLRDGLVWSDGEPFTADDVVFTYSRYANPATGSAVAGKFATVEGIEAITDGSSDTATGFSAPDDDTFVMTLTVPNVAKTIDLVAPTLFVLPEHIYGEEPIDGLGENPIFREPEVGIGPYLFSSWVTDDQVEFVANPEYRSELGLDRIYAKFMATDAAQAQLQTGEIDFATVAAADVSAIESIPGVTLHSVGGGGIMALHNAADAGKLSDTRVRQAIMYGIDRQALVDQVLGGYGEVVDTIIHGPEWAMPEGLTHYERDVDKAKELLADAGWDPATEVRLEIVPGPKDREQVLTIIAAQLQEIGMNAVVTQLDNAGLSEVIANRDFDLLISGYGLFNVDPAAMNGILLCDNGALSRWCDPALDEALLAGVAEADQDARAEIYAEAQAIFNETLPIFPLYVPDTLGATSERLQGFKLNPLPISAFWNAAEWTLG